MGIAEELKKSTVARLNVFEFVHFAANARLIGEKKKEEIMFLENFNGFSGAIDGVNFLGIGNVTVVDAKGTVTVKEIAFGIHFWEY
jgi:hypothetical protein